MSADSAAKNAAHLSELRGLAGKATPGPWRAGAPNFSCVIDHGTRSHPGPKGGCVYTYQRWWDNGDVTRDTDYTIGDPMPSQEQLDTDLVAGMWDYERGGIQRNEDALYIAALSPDVVLALLDEIEALRARLLSSGASHAGSEGERE